ncbi:hypothetical protein HG530_010387 [Fusarium avenaceum]|nr:hypothetical protein HG530_010387 [Fusarium avenaceum]
MVILRVLSGFDLELVSQAVLDGYKTANENFSVLVFYHRKALISVVGKKTLNLTKIVLFFTVKERHPAEPYHSVSDTALTKQLADSFGDADNDHSREDVVQSTCQFKHDDNHGYGNVHDTTQRSGSSNCQQSRLEDSILLQVLLAECLDSQVPLDHKGSVETSKDTNQDIEQQLKEVPVILILNLEHDQLARSERVHSSENSRRYQSAEVTPPQRLERELIRHLLEREEHAANRTAKSDCDTRSSRSAQKLPRLGSVALILVEESRDDISRAHGVVHTGAFFADRKA